MSKWESILLLAALTVSSVLFAAGDPIMGTWKLNPEKSKQNEGQPPKSFIQKYEPNGSGGIKSTADVVRDDGVAEHVEYSANFDGKQYPRNNDRPASGKIMLKRIDDYTFETQTFRPGSTEPGVTTHHAVSRDGKTMTVTAKGVNTRGLAFENVTVYERQ
jgi:hypothetical protein